MQITINSNNFIEPNKLFLFASSNWTGPWVYFPYPFFYTNCKSFVAISVILRAYSQLYLVPWTSQWIHFLSHESTDADKNGSAELGARSADEYNSNFDKPFSHSGVRLSIRRTHFFHSHPYRYSMAFFPHVFIRRSAISHYKLSDMWRCTISTFFVELKFSCTQVWLLWWHVNWRSWTRQKLRTSSTWRTTPTHTGSWLSLSRSSWHPSTLTYTVRTPSSFCDTSIGLVTNILSHLIPCPYNHLFKQWYQACIHCFDFR